MSKPSSELVKGTDGSKKINLINPQTQKELVTAWAILKAKELETISKRQREKFNTACIAVDEATGNVYYGINGGIDKSNDPHNEILFGSSNNKNRGLLPSRSLNLYPSPHNCAESDAINQALNAGASISNIHIYVISTSKYDFGKPKHCCENCTYAFKGKIKKNNTGWTK